MSDPLGLSVGTTNLVAARVGNQPVTRRAVLTLAGDTISGFVERVGDRVPLVTPDGQRFLAEQLLVEALEAMVQVSGGPSPDIAIAVPAHWGASTMWAFRSALGNSRALSQTTEPIRLVSDAVAALTALQANPGITVNGVVALIDFGGSGTSITLADAASSFEPIAETLRYPDFSGDLIDQALLSHVLDNISGDIDPAGTAAVGSLSRLREECRLAKERLSEVTATQLVVELPGHRSDVRITRDELQQLIRPSLDGAMAALDELAERNGATPNRMAALAIVGGGASIPFVAQRLSEHTRLPLVTTPQPALNAAVGAALFAAFGADADAPTGASAVAVADADAPTGAAAAATDATAAAAVFDGPLPEEPGSATFRALAWSQEEGGDEPVPYTGENPYGITETTIRPAVEYVPATGPVIAEPRRPWHRVAGLVIGAAAVIAIVTVGGVAYALTSASEDTKAKGNSSAEQPKPEPPAPPKEESPKPPEPPPPPPEPPPSPETETVTETPPPPPSPSPTPTPTTTERTTTTRTTTTTSPTTTTTSPTTTTSTTTTTTTTTTTSTTPSMTTSYINVPFVPVPVPVQVPNTGPVQQPPQYQPPYQQPYQPPVYPQSPWG